MKSLLTTISIVEAMAGIALVFVPSFIVSLILGTPITDSAGFFLARLTGAALLSLGVGCWLSRNSQQDTMIKAMALYNICATAIFLNAVIVDEFSGTCLLSLLVIHSVLMTWCCTVLAKQIQF